MKVACCQTNIIRENKNENFESAKRLVIEAAKKGADVVCLPELFSTGATTLNTDKFSESANGETCLFLSGLAKDNGVYIVGSMIEKVGVKSRNACAGFDRNGRIISKYHKIHPFTFDKEDIYFEPGDALAFFEIGGIKCTTFICYDLRFPEIFRIAALSGAEVCFVQASWPYPRQTHWQILLKARAIENQMFVVGVNRIGETPENKYFGLSAIINPLGEVLAEGKEGDEDVVVADIDVSVAREWRSKFSCLKDARYDLYKKLYSI
jgi:predicted amidohydrolase